MLTEIVLTLSLLLSTRAAVLDEKNYSFTISRYNPVIDQLDKILKKVTIADVLDSAQYQPLNYDKWMRDTPFFMKGWRWDQKDSADETNNDWQPQGVTTSWDAGYPSGAVQGNDNVLLVSWNDQRNKTGASSAPGKGVRVSFVRKGTADHIPANRGYIHALLVEPYMNGSDPDYRSLENVISGGLVWRKDYLYITDDKIGLRVFDLRHIYKVQNGNNAPVGNSGGEYWGSQYPYIIPQAYIYTKTLSEGTNFNPHPMSLDRNFTPPCLVIGESTSVNNNSTFVRWSLNDTTNLLATDSKGQSGASWAYKTNIYNAEGITFAQDNYFITTNDGDDIKGELYQWRPGTWANAYEGVFPPGVQAISYKPAGEELWVVGNIPGKRYVMALNASLRNTTFPADDTGNGTSTPPTVTEAPVERKMTSGAIAGATIAVLVTVAGVLAAILMFQRRRKRKSVAVVAEHYAEERVYSKPELAGVQRGVELWSQKELPAYRQQVMHEMPHATERYELGSGRDPVRELPTGMGKWN